MNLNLMTSKSVLENKGEYGKDCSEDQGSNDGRSCSEEIWSLIKSCVLDIDPVVSGLRINLEVRVVSAGLVSDNRDDGVVSCETSLLDARTASSDYSVLSECTSVIRDKGKG